MINILRKIFIPTISDLALPVEELGKDAWLNMEWSNMSVNEIKALVVGRQLAIKYVINGLIELKIRANDGIESPAEKILREKKNSTK